MIPFHQFYLRHPKLVVLASSVVLVVGMFCVGTVATGQQAAQNQQGQERQAPADTIVAFSGTPDFGNTTFGQNLPSGQSSLWTVSGTVAISNPNSACVWGGTCQLLRSNQQPASVNVRTISSFSLANGTILLDSLVSAQSGIFNTGNFAAVGLASGTDQDNAIEFVGFESVNLTNNPSLTCRTVSGGLATDTNVPLPTLTTGSLYQYEIVARSNVVKFYVDGALVATHTTNIPHTLLNLLFSLATPGGATGADLFVSTTSFRQTLIQ